MVRKKDNPNESLVRVRVTFHSCTAKRALSRFPIRFSYFYTLARPLETVRLLPFCFHLITDVKGLRRFPAHFFHPPATAPPLFLYLFQLSARREFVIAFNFLPPSPCASLHDGKFRGTALTAREPRDKMADNLYSIYVASLSNRNNILRIILNLVIQQSAFLLESRILSKCFRDQENGRNYLGLGS